MIKSLLLLCTIPFYAISGLYLSGLVNKSLVGSVIDGIERQSEVQCEILCQHNKNCTSINYGQQLSKCELNRDDRYTAPNRFINRPGYIYYDIKRYPIIQGETCVNGFDTKNCETRYRSCKEILESGTFKENGLYKLWFDDDTTSDVYCHMEPISGCGGGGWTMVMKIDGSKPTFSFSSNYWKTKSAYNEKAAIGGIDSQETKLSTYWSAPFTKLCLGMRKNAQQDRWILLHLSASSLYDVISDDQHVSNTSLGRSQWLSLIKGSTLQPYCNWEGFNVGIAQGGEARARIGIVANDQNDCWSSDSVLGFGLSDSIQCQRPVYISCGFDKKCSGIHVYAFTMGYIFLQ